MPLIQIRRNPEKVTDYTVTKIIDILEISAARELSCAEGTLRPRDIMFEVDDFGPLDRNTKDLHVRVIAHDYPSRRGEDLTNLDRIRRVFGEIVCMFLMNEQSWYVWVLLSTTSYGSDTED